MPLSSLIAGLLVLAVAGCTRVVYVGDSRSSADDRVSVQREAEGVVAADLQQIVIENQFGPVVVTGADDSLGWTWTLECWGKDSTEAQAQADKWRLETATEVRGSD
jgi:hypothetical protein